MDFDDAFDFIHKKGRLSIQLFTFVSRSEALRLSTTWLDPEEAPAR